eukprot:gene24653-10276_t
MPNGPAMLSLSAPWQVNEPLVPTSLLNASEGLELSSVRSNCCHLGGPSDVLPPKQQLMIPKDGGRIMLATDGVWDVISISQVVNLSRCKKARDASVAIMEQVNKDFKKARDASVAIMEQVNKDFKVMDDGSLVILDVLPSPQNKSKGTSSFFFKKDTQVMDDGSLVILDVLPLPQVDYPPVLATMDSPRLSSSAGSSGGLLCACLAPSVVEPETYEPTFTDIKHLGVYYDVDCLLAYPGLKALIAVGYRGAASQKTMKVPMVNSFVRAEATTMDGGRNSRNSRMSIGSYRGPSAQGMKPMKGVSPEVLAAASHNCIPTVNSTHGGKQPPPLNKRYGSAAAGLSLYDRCRDEVESLDMTAMTDEVLEMMHEDAEAVLASPTATSRHLLASPMTTSQHLLASPTSTSQHRRLRLDAAQETRRSDIIATHRASSSCSGGQSQAQGSQLPKNNVQIRSSSVILDEIRPLE